MTFSAIPGDSFCLFNQHNKKYAAIKIFLALMAITTIFTALHGHKMQPG